MMEKQKKTLKKWLKRFWNLVSIHFYCKIAEDATEKSAQFEVKQIYFHREFQSKWTANFCWTSTCNY